MTVSVSPNQSPASVSADRAALTLLGGLAPGGFDSLLPGGVYAVVPQAPPARYPLWALFLPTAVQAGRTCHVLTRSDPAEFLNRVQRAGWPQATDAWAGESLRLYAMADGFSKLLFRRDVTGLATELVYWGVKPGDCLLVDAADALLSLHDLFLATAQLSKLRAWAKEMQIPMLLNFTLAGAGVEKAALTSLMDHFSGMARLRSDESGPSVTLEYWQSGLGTSAERTVWLREEGGNYELRELGNEDAPAGQGLSNSESQSIRGAGEHPAWRGTNDPVWTQELQMLMPSRWQNFTTVSEVFTAAADGRSALVVLRFDALESMGALAKDVHSLRSTLGSRVRIAVAEHRVSLRYANEIVLLRLGADTVIRKDVPLSRWPEVLDSLQSLPARPMPDLDADAALAKAALPQGRGFLLVPAFLEEVHAAMDRGNLLGVPFGLGAIKMRPDRAVGDAVAQAQFRRNGDFISSDGEKLYVLFNACSFTRGTEVLNGLFAGEASEFMTGVDWMASQLDIQQCLERLTLRHEAHPIDVIPQPIAVPPQDDLAPALAPQSGHEPQAVVALAATVTEPEADGWVAPAGSEDLAKPSTLPTVHEPVIANPASHTPIHLSTPNLEGEHTTAYSAVNSSDAQKVTAIADSACVESRPLPTRPPFEATRVTVVVPHVPDPNAPDYAHPEWTDEEVREIESGLADDLVELGLDKRAVSSSAADVNALIRRLAKPAPSSSESKQLPRQSGRY